MKKLAIFVEGATEVAFLKRLLCELMDARKLRIESFKATGGNRTPRTITRVQASAQSPAQTFYVQVVDAGTDNRVASDIRENYDGLVRSGFETIIGIRDVYPVPRADLSNLRRGLTFKLRTKPIEVIFVLGVMETEAWFLAEHTHYQRIHPNLGIDRIRRAVLFDPSVDDMQLRNLPHDDLHNIYALEGLAYKKSRIQVQRTVQALDYSSIYLGHAARFPDIRTLVASLDSFFS